MATTAKNTKKAAAPVQLDEDTRAALKAELIAEIQAGRVAAFRPGAVPVKTYYSEAKSRTITVPDRFIPLEGGTNEKRSGVAIQFKNGALTTSNAEWQAIIESQPDYSETLNFGDTNPDTRSIVTIIPRPNTAELAQKAKARAEAAA